MLKGAFIGFGNVAEKGHAPGWRAREDVKIVAATDAALSRRNAFLAAFPEGRWRETSPVFCPAKHSISSISARRLARMRN